MNGNELDPEMLEGMTRAESILTWLLRISGVVLLVALGAVLMPFEWMDLIHRRIGLGELPHIPIIGYLTRSVSALYALHGALLLFVARDVRRYLPLVRFLAVASGVFGVLLLGLDQAVGMPLQWTIGEGPYVTVLSGLLFWLVRRVEKERLPGRST
jgi:hypothetical protein